MTSDKFSTTKGNLQHVGWCIRRKTVILIAVCCFAALAYSLSCFRSKSGRLQVAATPKSAARHTESLHAKDAQQPDSRTQEASQDDVKPPRSKQALNISQLHVRVPVHARPTLRRDQDSSSFSSISSSVDENEDEDDFDLTEEIAPVKQKGTWQRRLPQAIIIGVKKGGTRALLEFLRIHPQIAVSGKEVHYFDRYYNKGTEWYRKSMPFSYENQITVEKTPGYFVSSKVPVRIRHLSPAMKLIVVVRNPIDRAISDHAQSVSKGKTTPFEEKALLSHKNCKVDDDWSAIRIGLYSQHLSTWLKYFPISQLCFVNGENMVSNPGKEMEKVQDFLHISRTITAKSFVFNETKGFPCLRENKNGDYNVKCLGESKGRMHRPVNPHVRQCLTAFYRPHNEQFYKMTGVNFHWEDTGD